MVDPKTVKIETGWEYKEDAFEHKAEWDDKGYPMKVVSKQFLITRGVNPDDDSNWAQPQLNEESKSKAQQRFMGMVHAYKKGELPDASDEVKNAAKSMKADDAEDFASTKHKGLPEKVKPKKENKRFK